MAKIKNKKKIVLFIKPVTAGVIVFILILMAWVAAGCSHTAVSSNGIKTAEEAMITITDNHAVPAGNDDKAGHEGKAMLAVPVIETMPYYFTAVFNEQNNMPPGSREIENNYHYLIEMVSAADAYNIKLTLLFSVRWADYISGNASRLALLDEWSANGHEIACCHQDIYCINWDGYTDLLPQEAEEIRLEVAQDPGGYIGTMDDFTDVFKKINPGIRSGAIKYGREIQGLGVVSDGILFYIYPGSYSEGMGFYGSGKSVQVNVENGYGKAGINEFIKINSINGIERSWLGYFHLSSRQNMDSAIRSLGFMDNGYVYGTAISNNKEQARFFYGFLEYLNQLDPEGLNSRTVAQVIEDNLIPALPAAY